MKRKRTVQELAARYKTAKPGERQFAWAKLHHATTRELQQAVRAKRKARS